MANRTPTQARRPNPRQPERPPSLLERPWLRWAALGLALFVIAGALGVWYLSRDPEIVTADRAVEDFRSRADSAPTATPTAEAPAARDAQGAEPAQQQAAAEAQAPTTGGAPGYGPLVEGVYTFATEGYEETDALTGARHDYPDETAMTITKGGCGWIARWEPMRERWEETEMCERPEGTSMGRYTMYHEFFQRGVQEDFTCPGSIVQKPAANPGETWTFQCSSERSKVDAKVTVVGFEDVDVGGQRIRTTRYRYDIKVSGDNNGTLVQERWLSSNPRVMARLTQEADLRVATPFGGDAGYKESFRIDLKSLTPRT